MLYLSRFTFPSQERESLSFHGPQRQCYNTNYPFGIIARFDPTVIEFEPVTILYGGNGTGKSTALNVIAEKLRLERESPFNATSFYGDYVNDLTWDYLRAFLMMGSSSSTLSPLFTRMAVSTPSKSARMAL